MKNSSRILWCWLPAVAVLAGLPNAPLLAQKLDLEKFQDVSGKARRGYLEDVKVDNAAGKIDLRFITKSTNKEVASQTYHFDTKYNLLGVEEASVPMEKVKGYRGENYSREAITIGTAAPVAGFGMFANMPGTLLIQHKRINYKWSWLGGGYRKSVKLLETEKPKTESGGGFHVVKWVDDDVNGGLLVLATENIRLTNMKAMKIGMHLLYFNDKAELVSDQYLDPGNGSPFTLVEMGQVGLDKDEAADDSNQPAPDVALMLAYNKGNGANKDLHPATEYKYMRLSAQGQIKETIRVDSPVSAWLVAGFVPMADGSVLLYGPGNDDSKKHLNEVLGTSSNNQGMTPEEAFKAKSFLVGKIKGGAVTWVTKTDLKDFETKQQVPAGQKRTPDYTGKRFAINLASETPNGDIFIGGQNFVTHRGNSGGGKFLGTITGVGSSGPTGPTRDFSDLLLFHFDGQGHLRSQYGLRRAENNAVAEMMPTNQFMRAAPDSKSVYWIVQEMDGWRTVDGLTEDGKKGGFFDSSTEKETISYPSVTRIDLNAATIGAQKTFGVTKEGKYYLSNRHMTLPVGDRNKQLVFFGENKKGSTMWFGQMPLE